MHILGLSSLEHGPAAAIIGETGLVAAIEEGKLARTRTAEGIPRRAIQFCLESAGIKWPDIDRMVTHGTFSSAARAVRAQIERLFLE